MNSVFFMVGIAIVLMPAVTSLRCHSCKSETSQLDCHQHKKNEDCYREEHRCAIASYSIADENYYFKGCVPEAQCNVKDYCETRKDKINCKIDCCSGDLCNSGMRREFSVLLVIASILFALFLH